MKEITEKLRKEAIAKFLPIAEQMREEGADDKTILIALKSYKDKKRKEFLNRDPYDPGFNELVNKIGIHFDMKSDNRNADSYTELAFYELLKKSGIDFNFQYKIGPYRVDYLIGDFLVFEGDGPHHDQNKEYDEKRDEYLRKMGYKVLRLKWSIVEQMKEMVISEIKKQLEA